MNTWWIHPQNTARIHRRCTPSTQLEYTVTVPPVHSQNTQSLYPQYTTRIQSLYYQYTARIHSHCTPKYTTRIYSHYTATTQLEYTVTAPQVHSLNT
ncbi:hypothetical protein NP493_2192g00001 [Ridgeia piscesae]|uniref:Uncharacterized protein n=1 Tax=Ridgeia piscesae TaxID=27915 RepID=A0AAD9JJJ2_RIDPI|nr:hypothetical protein NP493_2192g00001 [Ridgeia piscesae]